jgi:hypothetical protein
LVFIQAAKKYGKTFEQEGLKGQGLFLLYAWINCPAIDPTKPENHSSIVGLKYGNYQVPLPKLPVY